MSLLTPSFRKSVENLPSSPELAIIHLRDEIERWNDEPTQADDEATREQFVAFTIKFVQRNAIDIPLNGIDGDLQKLKLRLDRFCKEYELRIVDEEMEVLVGAVSSVSDVDSFGYANLNKSEKERIHGNISRIRQLIEMSDLTTRKKNALYDRLNQLAAEVDLSGTRTDRFFAFMGDAAFVLGDMASKAKPFTDEVKDMIKTIGKARSRKEGTALPPGEEVLRLPAPDERENDDAN